MKSLLMTYHVPSLGSPGLLQDAVKELDVVGDTYVVMSVAWGGGGGG